MSTRTAFVLDMLLAALMGSALVLAVFSVGYISGVNGCRQHAAQCLAGQER